MMPDPRRTHIGVCVHWQFVSQIFVEQQKLAIGSGSKNTLRGDYSGHMIYAMEVTDKVSMREYYNYSRKICPGKIADWNNIDRRRQYGDCIYKFKRNGMVRQLTSVHDESQIDRDLSGDFVLVSDNYWYWGQEAVKLPKRFNAVVPKTQGHLSDKNEPYQAALIRWVSSRFRPTQHLPINQLDGTDCN